MRSYEDLLWRSTRDRIHWKIFADFLLKIFSRKDLQKIYPENIIEIFLISTEDLLTWVLILTQDPNMLLRF